MANSEKKAQKSSKRGSKKNEKRLARTEAEIEAQILGVFQKIFPWLDPRGFRFQTTFSFKLGRSLFQVDGAEVSRAQGRSDVIVTHKDIALAILELKRPGWKLTEEDFQQGQSYAKFLSPPPPLVIVSNAKETWIRTSNDGADWPASNASEQRLADTIKAALRVTSDQQRYAISTLMGPGSDVWTQGVRTTTEHALKELMGGWKDESQPLVSDFSIKREAAEEIKRALVGGKKIVLVSGAPLSGKTNVLRQLASETQASDDFALLYLDLSTSVSSVFRAVAYLLNAALAWPASDDEARQWILQLSQKTEGPSLVVALDGLNSGHQKFVEEFTELATATFGPNLRCIATINTGDEQQLLFAPDRRTRTRIGRTAAIVRLEPLSDSEFDDLGALLAKHRVHMLLGAKKSAEWRQPWIVRALVADIPSALKDKDTAALAPPFLGISLLRHVTERFVSTPEIRAAYGQLAKSVITAAAAPATAHERLGMLLNFSLDSEHVQALLPQSELREMMSNGYLSVEYLGAGKSRVVPRLQELLAAEIAAQVAGELVARSRDGAGAAAQWLIQLGSSLPFGAVISAAALREAGSSAEGLSWGIVKALVDTPPRVQKANIGAKFVTVLPSGLLDVTVLEDGKLRLSAKGKPPLIVDAEETGDLPHLIADIFPWLCLSYLASTQMLLDEHGTRARGDYALLLRLGSSPIILRGADDAWDKRGYYSHWIEGDGEVACHKNGIIEPITESMRLAILRDGSDSDAWIAEALQCDSVPLLMRALTALLACEGVSDSSLRAWVGERIKQVGARINQANVIDHHWADVHPD